MQTLYMKIHEYEESSGSLLVSFASDTTKSSNPDDYPAYAYQPARMWPDITDPQDIKRRIAIAGVGLIQVQVADEQFNDDPARIAAFKAMVGESQQYDISTLNPTDSAVEV